MQNDMFDALRYAIPSLFKENCENRVADCYIPDLLEALDRCSITCSDKCNGCPYNHLTLCENLEAAAKRVIEKLIEKKDTSSVGHLALCKLKETYDTLSICASKKYCPCNNDRPCPFTDDTCWTIDRDAHEAIEFLMTLPDKQNTQLQLYELLHPMKITKEDIEQVTDFEKAVTNARDAILRSWNRQYIDAYCKVKSIEVSVDHNTVVVIWDDGDKTIVNRSEKDPDDIYMAFTAALAKKIYGSNSAIRRLIDDKMNQHKPKEKKEKTEED